MDIKYQTKFKSNKTYKNNSRKITDGFEDEHRSMKKITREQENQQLF